MSSSSFADGDGLNPRPQNLHPSSEHGGMTSIEGTIKYLNLTDSQLSDDIRRLQSRVDALKAEEMGLTKRIAMLKQEEMSIGHGDTQFEAMRKKELELSEKEQDFHLMKSQMESQFSDKEFELSHKQRELQHLEDQLHMKSKDLKQKEFDIMNADSPADISSGQLAELADRQYELDKKEKDLHYREQRLREWTMKLQEKDNEYQQRLDILQRREAYSHTNYSDSSSEQYSNRGQHSQTSPQQYPAYVQRVNTSPQQYLQPENTTPQAAEVLQQSGQPSRNYRPTNMTAPVLDTQQYSRQPEHTPISDQPPPGQIPQHSSAPAIHQEGPSAQQQTMGANADKRQVAAADDQFARDMELAKRLMEEEEDFLRKSMHTDEMLALTLQQEEMNDGLAHADQLNEGVAAGLIKKELDDRLTEEQRRKKQEEQDFFIAQRLYSDEPKDDEDKKD